MHKAGEKNRTIFLACFVDRPIKQRYAINKEYSAEGKCHKRKSMRNIRRAAGQVIILICSIIGAGISIYLTFVHYQHIPLICSNQGVVDCAQVLSSSFSVVPGTSIPISVPGLGWCLVSAALAFAGLSSGFEGRGRRLLLAQFAWSLLGIITVLYLVYAEIVRIRAICAWCTGLHVLILIIFLVTIVHLQRSAPGSEQAGEDETTPTGTYVSPRRE